MMIVNRCFLVFAFAAVVNWCNAQGQSYKVGFARVSTEPGSYPFSLALGGYGYPPEGRFSMELVNAGSLGNCTAFTGNVNSLYCISNNQILTAAATPKLLWKNLAPAGNIKLLAAGTHTLYAVDDKGDLLSATISAVLKWKNTVAQKNINAITAGNNYLYTVNDSGVVSRAIINGKQTVFKKISNLPGAVSIAYYKGYLYGLTAANDILKLNVSQSNAAWLKIARYNGLTYDVKLSFLAISAGRLYGADSATAYITRHRSEGDLCVTAMAISSGNKKVVLAGADLVGFNGDFTDEVKYEIWKRYKVPPAAILINASHTHFAPVTQRWDTWPQHNQRPDSVYFYTVLKPAMINAIAAAIKNMAPSTVYFGRGNTAIGKNRSLPTQPLPYDAGVDVLMAENNTTKKQTILFLTGCHAVFNNSGLEGYTISANFPGVTRRTLQKNENVIGTMFIQGCAGDINPVSANYIKTGEDLAADINTVLGKSKLSGNQSFGTVEGNETGIRKPMSKINGGISFFMDTVNYTVHKQTPKQLNAFKEKNAGINDLGAQKNVRWANIMLNLTAKNAMPDQMPVYIQTINIGNWKLIGLSREVVTDYSIGIKQIWPDAMVSVAGYCNDVSSYLPTEKHIMANTYEGYDSFFWYAQPDQFNSDIYNSILNKIKNAHH